MVVLGYMPLNLLANCGSPIICRVRCTEFLDAICSGIEQVLPIKYLSTGGVT